ncbi:MAG: tRNA pseudouridine(38-40) synthase TruA [Bacteroidetes bacterium RIFCSPLOWO2_12_FULL_31_6]|nr:MAG: tRNA pseudouridine(38-40) synthase TruA [Bacteroidetes bacterium RIFCSPLOWO2_12_FULL_31_6]
MRYFIKLGFKGTQYHGWQTQANATSIQSVLDNSLSILLKENIFSTGAGRTDTGVHAKEFYAHFDILEKKIFDENFIGRLNIFLPKDIVVFEIFSVDDKMHARFDATSRTYEYHIHQKKDPFLEQYSCYVYKKLDVEKMNEAAQLLLQYKDFKCFSKSRTQVNNFICDIKSAKWNKDENRLIFTITANRFLRNMVRAIVGTLLEVGCGELSIEDFKKVIESGDRANAGESVDACGLYLTKIEYQT